MTIAASGPPPSPPASNSEGAALPSPSGKSTATAAAVLNAPAMPSEESSLVPSRRSDRAGRKRSARLSTYAVRKREKAALTQQVAALSRQVEALKAEQRVASALMRQAIQAQLRAIAYTQAAVSGITQQTAHLVSPFGPGLRLSGTDAEREAILSGRRGVSVRIGRAYLAQRRQFLDDNCGAFSESSVFETPSGDCCISRFEAIPLRLEDEQRDASATTDSVRRVMEALVRSLSNAELVISETSEFITIRQDGDSFAQHGSQCLSEHGVALQRVLSTNTQGSLLVEAEAASFVEFFERDADGIRGAHGVMTTEVIEDDDRYPYQPDERVRRDVSSVIMVSSEQSSSRGDSAGEAGGDGNNTVMLTLWSQCTFRCPSGAATSAEVVRALPPRYSGWGGGMLNDMKEILQCPQLL